MVNRALTVLSASLIAQLEQQNHIVAGSARPLGAVATGIAVPQGAPSVAIDSSQGLKSSLTAAKGLYVPDLHQSSAGIHIAGMLKALGLNELLADRIHEYPNGATAMRELARNGADGMIGCTQVTEIMNTTGVRLEGKLPSEHALNTVYMAAVCSRALQPVLAAKFVEALSSNASSALRLRSGFAI